MYDFSPEFPFQLTFDKNRIVRTQMSNVKLKSYFKISWQLISIGRSDENLNMRDVKEM